ncbi:MAG: hypothetical protein KatS3mg029_0356 [Saprospiraceae bacterium]|nr:MAG: hypothetical protein KatS3mg029_0356 [Saprospiraceae bacterium]
MAKLAPPTRAKKLSKKQSNNEHDKAGKRPTSRRSIDALRYSGMAFQLVILIAIGAYVGRLLDDHFQTDKPYLTALSVVVFLLAGLYLILRDLLRS